MLDIVFASFVVFAITLTVNKSKLFACKREFVQNRYKASLIGDSHPGFVHEIWHAWWTCPMCFGFWVSLVVALFFNCHGYVFDVLILYSLNWLIHCMENFLVTNTRNED